MRVFPTRRLFARRNKHNSGRRFFGALALVALASGAIALGQFQPDEVGEARSRLAGPVSSLLGVVQEPLKVFSDLSQRYIDFRDAEKELARLREENDALKSWKWRAVELERQLADLSALSRVVSEPRFDYVTTRVVARSIGTGRRSALIGAGKRHGVSEGGAVLNQRGLVGVSYEVGPGTSRVLFLNDPGAQVLVSIGRGFVTAIVSGTSAGHLEIRDVGVLRDIAIGDEVITAGQSGGVPRGLRVGKVVAARQGVRIEPYVDFGRLEFVSVLVDGEPTAEGSRANTVGKGAAVRGGSHFAARIDDRGVPLVPLDGQAEQVAGPAKSRQKAE